MPLFPDSVARESASSRPSTAKQSKIKDALIRFFRVFFYGLGVVSFLGICIDVYTAVKMSSPAAIPENTGLKLDLDTVLYESRPTDFMTSLSFGDSPTVADVVTGLKRAAEDPNITLLFAKLTSSNLSLAQIQEVRSAVRDFAAAGKKTVVYAPTLGETGGGMSAYYLATAFDEIWLQPTGGVGVAGVFLESPYLRKALEKIGIKPSFESRYEYKTGADMMNASEMSAAERKNLKSLLSDFVSQIAADVAKARNITPEKAKKLLVSGPYNAEEALGLNLVDRLEYADVLERELEEKLKNVEDFFDYAFATQPDVSKGKPVIAYIQATGVIQFGDSIFGGDSYASIMGVSTINQALRDAADDDDVKAVVLRIDSPGGGYTPSDSLWRNIIYLKEQKKKPVYCSMSSTAASGGYFISLACDKVYAQPSTLTGSIGVFGGKLVVSDLLKKLNITVNSVSIGKNAGMFSANKDFTPAQKKIFNKMLDDVYADFTRKTAERRGFNADQINAVSRGRVFTGNQALKNGLIDETGGILQAVADVSEAVGEKKPLPVLEYPLQPSRFEMLMQMWASGTLNAKAGSMKIKGVIPAAAERLKAFSGDMRLFMPPL